MDTIVEIPDEHRTSLDAFADEIARFQRGELSAPDFHAAHVLWGIYAERNGQSYMVRARCPAGILLPRQIRALAETSTCYGSGVLHLTTRQNVQVHGVAIGNLHAVVAELHAAGLAIRGGGGNTVRSLTACPDAGVCPNEIFDPTPYAIAATRLMLNDPASYRLPRKYKIAVSGCPRDCSGAAVSDLGFVACRRDGAQGFAVYVGGGMGARSCVGHLLHPFVPADDFFLIAEAAKRVFDQHGNRQNRRKARLRFLIEDIGLPRFRELYEAELDALRRDRTAPLALQPIQQPAGTSANEDVPAADGFELWQSRCVAPQKQPAYCLIHLRPPLGHIKAERFQRLADLAERYGQGALRTTLRQGFLLRWVPRAELPSLHRQLCELGLAAAELPVAANLVACTGASTCRIGVCDSRKLAAGVREALLAAGESLDGLPPLAINISGCLNSCGRHSVADVGLYGVVRPGPQGPQPHFVLQLGGRLGLGETRLAIGTRVLPAQDVPAAVVKLLRAFRRSPCYPDFARFVDSESPSPSERGPG